MLHPDASFVIFFDDAFGERESESPASFLGCEARAEHVAQVFLAYALAGIAHLYYGLALFFGYGYGYGAFASHCVDSVLAQVFYHPLKERCVDPYSHLAIREPAYHLHPLGRTPIHIVHYVLHHLLEVGIDGFGQRAYLREAVGYELQTLHVVLHFGYELVVGIALAQYLHPCHEAGYGCTELMGCLL